MRKLKSLPSKHYPTTKQWWPPLWPATQYTCIPSSLCCVQSVRMQVHSFHRKPEMQLPSFCSRVVFLNFLILALFLSLLQVLPYLKWSFTGTFSPVTSAVPVERARGLQIPLVLLMLCLLNGSYLYLNSKWVADSKCVSMKLGTCTLRPDCPYQN